MLTKKRNALLNLGGGQMIGVAQDDTSGVFNLIVEKLAEIFHIHFAFPRIGNGCKKIKLRIGRFNLADRLNDIGKLSDT